MQAALKRFPRNPRIRVSVKNRGYSVNTLPGPATLLSEDEFLLRESVLRFAETNVKPHVRQMDVSAKLDVTVMSGLFRDGLMAISVQEKYGGAGLGLAATCVAVEALAETDPAVSVICDIQNTLLNTALEKYGTEEQKQKLLPRLAKDKLGAFCLSEATSGSDAFALKTSAVKKQSSSDIWTLNGTKQWISNAAEAEFFLIFANADFDRGHKGVTAFLVDKNDAKGRLIVGKKENKLGIRACSCCEVTLDGLDVPSDMILGEVGTGYKIAMNALNEGRIGIGAQMVGLAQGAMNATVPYCWERTQFGRPVAEFQGLSFQFASAATSLAASRALVFNAARLRDAGLPFAREAAFAKLHASVMAGQVASQAVEWAGGVGYSKEYPQEKFYRDAKIGVIYEGTSNMQLSTIAKFLENDYRPR